MVLERMMAKEPAERYQTPAEVVTAIEATMTEPVAPPPEREMPAHPAAFYRLGLSPAPGTAPGMAATPNPIAQQETSRTPRFPAERQPGFPTPAPRSGNRSASGGDPSLTFSPPTPSRGRRAIRRRRRLFRLAELLLFVLAAGAVGWLASREWMHAGNPVAKQPSPPPASVPAAQKAQSPQPFSGTIVSAGGSTFINPLMQRWSAVYEKSHGVKIDYRSVGSGKGVQGLLDHVYQFGCTDVALSDERIAMLHARGEDVIHVPLAMGAVVVTYNLPEVKQRLRFTGPALAGIYLGKIKRWNNPVLKVANPGSRCPTCRLPSSIELMRVERLTSGPIF